MHWFLLSKVKDFVLPLPPFPLPLPFPLCPLPLGSRGGGSCFGILGLGWSSEEMSDRTTVISLRHSSKDQEPCEYRFEIAPQIFLSALKNSWATTCRRPSSWSSWTKVCSAIFASKALKTCRWHIPQRTYAFLRTVDVLFNQSREKRTDVISISGVSSQHSCERSWISLRRGLDDLVSIMAEYWCSLRRSWMGMSLITLLTFCWWTNDQSRIDGVEWGSSTSPG